VIIHCWIMLSWPRRSRGANAARQAVAITGVGPDREPDQRAGRQQHEGIHGERRQERADGVDGGVDDEQGLASEVVSQRPGDERSRAGAQGCAGHHPPAQAVRPGTSGSAQMRARFGSRLTRRRVMTQAQLADTLAGCVNQQVNQARPGSITGMRDHLRGPGGTTPCAGFDDGEVTASSGVMPLRAGLPDRTLPAGLLSA